MKYAILLVFFVFGLASGAEPSFTDKGFGNITLNSSFAKVLDAVKADKAYSNIKEGDELGLPVITASVTVDKRPAEVAFGFIDDMLYHVSLALSTGKDGFISYVNLFTEKRGKPTGQDIKKEEYLFSVVDWTDKDINTEIRWINTEGNPNTLMISVTEQKLFAKAMKRTTEELMKGK